MKTSSELLTSIFVIALFALLFFSGLAYRQINSLKGSQKLVTHSFDINIELEKLFSFLKDAESNQRGLLITSDTSYLRNFKSSVRDVQSSMAVIRSLMKEETALQLSLDTVFQLITLRITILETTISLTRNDDIVNYLVSSSMKEGKRVMEEIRQHIHFLVSSERALMIERENDYRSDINFTPVTYLFVVIMAILILVFSFYKISRDTVQLQKSNMQIIVANRELENKNAELAKSEDRYHLMVNEVQDYAILLLDSNGVIQNWNKGVEKIKGYTENEIIGHHFSVFYPKEDVTDKWPDQLLRDAALNGRSTHTGWRIRKDGSKFWGNVVITALQDKNKNVVGFTKVTRDLTAQKEAEEQLLEYNKSIERKNIELQAINEEIDSFNYIASHDLQEPLRKIQTFISRISGENLEQLSDSGKEYFSRIRNSANRMQHLIDDLISFTHMKNMDKKFLPTDLNNVLSTVLDELRPKLEEKKAVVKVENLPTLKVIPFQMEQLFTNIIDNSLKYSKPDIAPIISISASIIDNANMSKVSTNTPKHFHKITIADNGIGFEQQFSETIFILFQRLHEKSEYSGTGIGLAICKKIVDNHNGFISAESKPNEGTQIHIFLPEEV